MKKNIKNTYPSAKTTPFVIRYRPAKHEGRDNYHNHAFTYRVLIDGSIFTNRVEGNRPVGFEAITENGEPKRFRWDRLEHAFAV